MRIPSQAAFEALDMEFSADELDKLAGHHDPDFHLEHSAFLVTKALRNGATVEQIAKAPDWNLHEFQQMKSLISAVSPATPSPAVDSFIWSIPAQYNDEDRIYFASAFLSYGETFSSLLASFRASNNGNVPDFVPVSWFKKFFDGEESLRDEGIVLQADVSMVLFGYWKIDDVIDFLVRNVDLKEVTKLRAAGVEDAEEIADMTELLPSEWLDEFFG